MKKAQVTRPGRFAEGARDPVRGHGLVTNVHALPPRALLSSLSSTTTPRSSAQEGLPNIDAATRSGQESQRGRRRACPRKRTRGVLRSPRGQTARMGRSSSTERSMVPLGGGRLRWEEGSISMRTPAPLFGGLARRVLAKVDHGGVSRDQSEAPGPGASDPARRGKRRASARSCGSAPSPSRAC